MTYNVTAEYASQNFDEIIQRADTEAEGVTIVKDNKSFVLIEQKELEALIETAELLQVPEILTSFKL
ncbi:MAG: type II toxin-antitoxin system Phd/YefM family antitoxin [Waterburya sp.]